MTFHKYPKIFTFGHEENQEIFKDEDDEIIIEEKIDGANFRFYINEHGEIIFGSRSQELSEDKEHKYQKNFERCIRHIKEKVYVKDLSKYKGLIFYGENCVKHTMNYDWTKIPSYLGFDIMSIKENKFLDLHIAISMFIDLGLDFVPVIKICKVKEIGKIDESILPKSQYADNFVEGVVFKNYSKQLFAKYVSNRFKEDNKKTFGVRDKSDTSDDTQELVFKYCTNQRIEKCIFKLIDDEEKLDLTMMHKLPKLVLNDIKEEHFNDIYESNWKIDFKKLRRLIPKRCFLVLQQVMVNNQLQ